MPTRDDAYGDDMRRRHPQPIRGFFAPTSSEHALHFENRQDAWHGQKLATKHTQVNRAEGGVSANSTGTILQSNPNASGANALGASDDAGIRTAGAGR